MNIGNISLGAMQRPDPAEMRQKMYQTADTDESGTITKDEFTTAMANRPAPPPGGMKGGARGAGQTEEAPSAEDIFSEMDADGSGEVTEDEMKAFDEARQAEREQKRADFTGSTEFFQKILQQLGNTEDSEESTSSAGSTSSTASTRDEVIAELIKRLQTLQSQSATYSANGTSSTESAGLFSTTV